MSRILHTLSLDTVGGVESVFNHYLSHPEASQHEHFVCLLHRACHPYFRETLRVHAADSFMVKYKGWLRIPRLFRQWRAARLTQEISPEILVIYNSPENPCAWAAAPFSKEIIYYERGAAWRSPEADKPVILENFKKTKHFFCNSRAAKRMLNLRFGVPDERCTVIHNPMRLAASPTPAELTPRAADAPVKLGIAGRMIPDKGMASAIHALPHLLQRGLSWELHIAGEGPGLPALKKTASKLGVLSHIRFHGQVKNMSSFYRGLDLFLCPSLRESLGNVVIEANGSGCPVIATAVDGLPEAMVPGETGLCLEPTLSRQEYLCLAGERDTMPARVYDPTGDRLSEPRGLCPRVLADAIWSLIQDPDKLQAMRHQAVRSSRERFSLENYVHGFHALIAKLTSPP